jgi:hypothetical protein
MLNHFTSKAYLVYAKYWGKYCVGVNAIAVFNTEKRAAVRIRRNRIQREVQQKTYKCKG